MNIDRLARAYRWIEYAAFGRALERSRFAFLDRLTGARRILMLGEGDGRALARLLTLTPESQIEVVELSAQMVGLARRRATKSAQVLFRVENALTASLPRRSYDGVVTLFFLDCFSEAETRNLIHRIGRAMAPGALWLVSDFAVPDRGWRHWHAIVWIWMMYRFFNVTTGLRTQSLPPIEKLLRRAGLRRLEWVEHRAGLIRSEVWQKF